jgi:hypothetical protein
LTTKHTKATKQQEESPRAFGAQEVFLRALCVLCGENSSLWLCVSPFWNDTEIKCDSPARQGKWTRITCGSNSGDHAPAPRLASRSRRRYTGFLSTAPGQGPAEQVAAMQGLIIR